MGGEPTFVSIDDRDAPEWNTAALGPGKRAAGGSAAAPAAHALRARRRAPPRPGEVVPGRAAAALGVLLLLPPRRRADLARAEPVRQGRRRARRRRRGRRGVHPRAGRAGWASMPDTCCPPTRTSTTTCGASGGCPSNVDVLDNRLDDETERARLARVFAAGLGEVAGYVLPLRARAQQRRPGPSPGRAAPGRCAATSCS